MKTDLLFKKLLYEWLEEKKDINSRSTYSKYEQLIRNHIVPYLGNVEVNFITDKVVKDFQQNLNEKSILCNENKRTILMIINKTCEMAYQKCLIKDIIYIKPGLSKKKPMVQVFNSKEQRKLEKYLLINNIKHGDAILLALYSGLRIGEICALKWKDIDFYNGSISVTKTVQRQSLINSKHKEKTRLIITEPKTVTSNRLIPLPQFIVEYFKNKCSNKPMEFFIFKDTSDIPLEPRTLQYAYKKILSNCNIPYKNFHCLRHTFATRCITIGCDVKTLSEILGHADIKITMEYYFHSSFEYKKKQINKLNSLS